MRRWRAVSGSKKQATSPAAIRGALGAPFVIAGALKSVYDLGLYVLFRNVDVATERPAR